MLLVLDGHFVLVCVVACDLLSCVEIGTLYICTSQGLVVLNPLHLRLCQAKPFAHKSVNFPGVWLFWKVSEIDSESIFATFWCIHPAKELAVITDARTLNKTRGLVLGETVDFDRAKLAKKVSALLRGGRLTLFNHNNASA